MNIKTQINAITIICLCLFCAICYGQESNNNKQLWAKSFLNKKAPKLVVQKWLSDVPDTKGKFVLIDFWATWCGPCRKVIPELNEWNKKYGDKLVIIGISDEEANVIQNVKDIKINYYSAIDTNSKLQNDLEVQGIPHCILLDPDGIVRWEGYPTLKGHELTEIVLNNILKKYSKQQVVSF